MKAILPYLIFITPLLGFSQLHHQMISSQGSTNITEGIVVTQTIGQQSIIGNSQVAGLAFGQGFQQSIWTRLINSNDQNFMAEYYPNPFFDQVTFRFTNMSDEIITIDIFSDTICPWCYIGKRKLQLAIDHFPNNHFELTWRPYQVNPDMSLEGMNRKLYLNTKFGGKDKATKFYKDILAAGKK